MSSEWMKVMLGEVARKKAEASEVQAELERRREECGPPPAPKVDSPASGHPAPGVPASRRPVAGRPDDPAQG